MLQESCRYLDAFQAALTDSNDLRMAAENLHVMFLRGYNVKAHGRHVAETARACVMYTKIPAALIPRFPKHAGSLAAFKSLAAFHTAFPAGRDWDGNELPEEKPKFPIFGSESLDKLGLDILIPLHTFKRHSSLTGTTAALAVPFVKDLLPELEQLYKIDECAGQDSMAGNMPEQHVPIEEVPISAGESEVLQQEYNIAQAKLYDEFAEEHLAKNVLKLNYEEPHLFDKISTQPMIGEGSARLFMYNAGTDCTKDPPRYCSPYRMKAAADEDHLDFAVGCMAKLLSDADSGIFISGRNNLIMRDMKRQISALKPKVGVKELEMEPDEAQFMAHIRIDSNKMGSIDTKDPYLHIVKSSRVWKSRRSVPRRFVPGNTAFKKMAPLPVLSKDAMTKIAHAEREQVFRTVLATDRWSPKGNKGATKVTVDDDVDEDEEEEECQDEAAPAVVDTACEVVFYWMELHPRVISAQSIPSHMLHNAKHGAYYGVLHCATFSCANIG